MERLEHATIKLIEKEELSDILFAQHDVIDDPVKKRLREIYLQKAERLGNTYKGKVKMIFLTADGQLMAVRTTIWAADFDHITLKGGIHIPTRAILDVEIG